ncbi:D-alanine--D-alanine ligase [Collinsella sp. zg1085]|uniref:D-alanine--D-alanine ligase family protein n=1 Tax=Collinsella sp. zg1085 TaxID=2844380 RepID=UPI001C0DA43D|nr:D-alanine--D-alanine ligase [Collinsella sp. zg1085]QWT17593.1 D-alanine--D-alanine ligase [Collinsella sp. zg1085]
MKREERSAMRVAVLAGGRSSEREISLASGANAAAALSEAGFVSVEVLDTAESSFIKRITTEPWDVAFIALHGADGEDGVIQGLLSFLHIPYTGSTVLASASASDKELAKLVYKQAGIPIATGIALKHHEPIDLERIVQCVGPECFVKPAENGSSFGISMVRNQNELPQAIERAFEYGNKILIEQRLCGTEITVGVFETLEGIRALPVVEVCFQNEGAAFYDLSVKYIDPAKIHRIPAQISEENYQRAQELAIAAHRALGCSGISRSDFIVTETGPVILETNTIPGMTDGSLYPDEIRHTDDLVFSEVCAALVELALHRNK